MAITVYLGNQQGPTGATGEGAVTVEDADAGVSVSPATTLVFPAGSVVDAGGGVAEVFMAGLTARDPATVTAAQILADLVALGLLPEYEAPAGGGRLGLLLLLTN